MHETVNPPTFEKVDQGLTSSRLAIRRLFASVILVASVLLVVRAVGVEPFAVPTGSMAPALLGNHRAAVCPHCGYPVRVGQRDSARPVAAPCPNCGCGDFDWEHAPVC